MKKCEFDQDYLCIASTECTHSSLIECLKVRVYNLVLELEQIRQKRAKRHSDVSTKWRNQALYYRRKSRLLEIYIEDQGVEAPLAQWLMGKQTTPKVGESSDGIKEDTNGEVPSDGTPEAQ